MQLIFRFLGGFIIIASLAACQSGLELLMPATATPIPTPTATATATATSTPSPTPTPDPAFEAGLPLIARVNGQPIFLATYQAEVRAITSTISRHGVDLIASEKQATVQQIEQQVLDGLISQSLIVQQAQKSGITITTEALQNYLAEFSPEQLAEWQTLNRLSNEELTTTLTIQLMANRLFDPIMRDVQPELQPKKLADWLSNQRNSAKIELYLATPRP